MCALVFLVIDCESEDIFAKVPSKSCLGVKTSGLRLELHVG